MISRTWLVSAGLAFAVAACSDRKDPATPPTTAPLRTSSDQAQQSAPAVTTAALPADPAFAKLVLDELPNLEAAESLAAWKKRHPDNPIELYAPMRSETGNEAWCVRSTVQTTIDPSRTFKFTAYFYLPEPPTPVALPVGLSPEQLIDRCRLGLVWAQVDDADPRRSAALATAVRDLTASTLGQGQFDSKSLWWPASLSWHKTGLWKRSGLQVVTASVDAYTHPADGSVTPAHALAAAAGPASRPGFDIDSDIGSQAYHDSYVAARQRVIDRVEEARQLAALEGDVDSAVRSAEKLFAEVGWSRLATAEERTSVYATADRWLSASKPLAPNRRSAALFVADQLVELVGEPLWEREESPPIRRRLEAQGAVFVWLELAAGWEYTHTWLKEARRLDPDGRAGELAFLGLMEKGFDTSGTCNEQGAEGFRAVIREGEAQLRRLPASPLNPQIHLLLSRAYADVVTLANGGGIDPKGERVKYGSEAPGARTKSLDHFTAAASSSSDPLLRDAWPDAWRLAAGLPPTTTRFYCSYD
jgi:hypothetical protein